MNTLKQFFIFIFLCVISISCIDDNDNDIDLPDGDYTNGYFITNEGPFQNGSGTITFVDDDGSTIQNVYKTVNNEDLGNIVQSMTISGDRAYIIVNNSHKLIVVDRNTMEKIDVIEGEFISNPRYLTVHNDTGYLSNWGDPLSNSDDFISIIDLNTNNVSSTIAIGEGPENMVISNNELFVNLEGGYSQNNKLSIIDMTTNKITENKQVGEVPNSSIVDILGTVWVLCGGNPSWTGNETSGRLYKISSTEVSYIEFRPGEHPEHLTYGDGSLYYNLKGKIYEMDFADKELPSDSKNGLDGSYYTLKFNEGNIYATDAGDYSSEGSLKIFSASSGTLLQTITTGIIPGDIDF